MAHIAEHINRIADFVEARIDEQFSGDLASRHYDKEPDSRLLRGLRRAVQEMRSKRALVQSIEENPSMEAAANLAMTFAWNELAGIAKEWKDHKDYLPEFALLAHQLKELPSDDTPTP
ncbi:hypothetical protein ACFVYE_32395 [Streptomyces sp. NPDC058239]|uniref:hypothetical protein n=1 Tax=Streptomyces sp. NPDC058239 TaxID=3346395 RepID=UPI0036ED03C7